ncbi:MAG: hypothetical protein JXR77_03470 [Lentisphaeria bacterium]|nr:hypothetical protein [Lentisphaeria bacterium]
MSLCGSLSIGVTDIPYRRIRAFYLHDPYAHDPADWADILELVREYNVRVLRAGSDAIPFITESAISRIVTVVLRPPKRERMRGLPRMAKEEPAVSTDWAAYEGGLRRASRGGARGHAARRRRRSTMAGSGLLAEP